MPAGCDHHVRAEGHGQPPSATIPTRARGCGGNGVSHVPGGDDRWRPGQCKRSRVRLQRRWRRVTIERWECDPSTRVTAHAVAAPA